MENEEDVTTVPEKEYRSACDMFLGWCVTCREFTNETTEPDIRGAKCVACGNRDVYGAEEALIQGFIDLEE